MRRPVHRHSRRLSSGRSHPCCGVWCADAARIRRRV